MQRTLTGGDDAHEPYSYWGKLWMHELEFSDIPLTQVRPATANVTRADWLCPHQRVRPINGGAF